MMSDLLVIMMMLMVMVILVMTMVEMPKMREGENQWRRETSHNAGASQLKWLPVNSYLMSMMIMIMIMKAVMTIDHDKHDDHDDHDCNEDNDHLAKRLSAISTVLLIPHSSHLKLETVAVVIFSRRSFFKAFLKIVAQFYTLYGDSWYILRICVGVKA